MWLLLPSLVGCGTPQADSPVGMQAGDEAAEPTLVEVDLGTHRLSEFDPVTNSTVLLEFQLGGSVLDKDETDFTSRMESHGNRVRDRVMVAARICEPSDFLDPQLTVFRRRLHKRINQALGKPLVQDVLLVGYSHKQR